MKCKYPVIESDWQLEFASILAIQRRAIMRKRRFAETQIAKILTEVEGGRQVKKVCRPVYIGRSCKTLAQGWLTDGEVDNPPCKR